MSQHRMLWVDDDAPGRFVYEAYLVEQAGWDLTWATHVLGAAEALCATPFDALVLDQMCAFHDAKNSGPLSRAFQPEHQLWSGCFLLRWLRGQPPPEAAPWLAHADKQRLWGLEPLEANRSIPAIIASAFHAETVERAIRSASPQDANIEFIAKPLSEDALLDFLEGVIG